MSKSFVVSIIVLVIWIVAPICLADDLPDRIRFNEHIRPIMSNSCFVCHGPDESANDSGLRLDSFEAAVEQAEAIVVGDADGSLVIQRITDADNPMPPSDFRHQLSDREKALIRKWIKQGAKYEMHWSYAPIETPEIPEVQRSDRVVNPIDAFVLKKLQQLGLAPSPLADKRTLLRRLSLDLIGLPPTPQELSEFLRDESDDAYEKQVDRLLASPHYGERMAARWLDIVRFSDTVGFHGDQNQHIFPYRDYVINSINKNQPFDQFTIDQLAGDLLPKPTEQQLTATGLVRLNMMTREGGAQPEEYLAKYSADRVRMVGTAWLGSTLGCCECHDHKYDPFSIKDFYSMGAFFDDVRQWGVYNNYGYTPNPDLRGYSNDHPFPPELRLRSPSLVKQIEYLERQLDVAAANQVSEAEYKSDRFRKWLDVLSSQFAKEPSLWLPVKMKRVSVSKEESYEQLDDDGILFSGKPKGGQSIKITTSFDQPQWVKAFMLEVLPDAKNDNKVGRSDGKFTATASITHVKQVEPGREMVEVVPRFVRIELPGNNKILSLAEVQVFAGGKNIALSGQASQSTTDHNGPAKNAIDDATDGNHGKTGVTHSKTESNPWWELDLKEPQVIDQIVVWNRTDGNLGNRLTGYRVVLLDDQRNVVFQTSPKLPKPTSKTKIPKTVDASELIQPENIAYAQADRYRPDRFSNGKASIYLGNAWRSGPNLWHLPADEPSLRHSAVYHLDRAIWVEPGDEIVFTIGSGDIGKFKLHTSSVARAVVDQAAANQQLTSALKKWTNVSVPKSDLLTPAETLAIRSAYYRSTQPAGQQHATVKNLRTAIVECYSGYAMTMVCQPVEVEKQRVSRVLPRGDWKNKTGEVVLPATPSFLPAAASSTEPKLSRLDLAQWIVAKSNPLTARHYVNRTWKHFFGNGLSNVLDDLGNQGEWPSHPGLLDWLASEFKSDWDRKRIAKLIVMSSTYRQRAAFRRELYDRDPHNRLLAQQSARRLEAEIVRDNALSIAGLLDTSWVGGRSVFPFQPPGYYANLQFPNRRYATQTNGLQYRRGLYMHWQRTFLHPMLTNFDAPSRDECTADRTLSNSPQQALTLLNDPVFVEAARALAVKINSDSDNQATESMIENAFELALARKPVRQEVEGLVNLYQRQLEYFQNNVDEANKFLSTGQYRIPLEMEAVEVAALGQVCRVILNLHETITRY